MTNIHQAEVVPFDTTCPTCHGGGEITVNQSRRRDPQCDEDHRCPVCRGTGEATQADLADYEDQKDEL